MSILDLDNITNIAKGLDKELLDMTYGDKYYRDVIQPAKMGRAPIPSRMEMIGQNLKNFGPVKAMFIGAQPGKYGERAMPTKAASSFLNKVGSVAKFGLNRIAPIFSILAPTELGSAELTEEDRQSMMMNNNMSLGIMNPELLNIDELDDDRSTLLDKRDGIFAAFKDKIDPSTLLSFLSNVYTGGTKQALTGKGIGKAFGNIRDAIGNRLGPASYGTSQAAFNNMTPSQQQAVGSIYGQGGIMQGYNAVSAFGRGPAGAIQNRIDAILGRKAPQTRISKQRVKDLQAALTNVGGAGSADYGPSGYEGMSDAASDQEMSEGGRGSRG